MYFLKLKTSSDNGNDAPQFSCDIRNQRIRKWSVLSNSYKNNELLQLIALTCCGPQFSRHIPCDFAQLLRNKPSPLMLGYIMALHVPYDNRTAANTVGGSVQQLSFEGSTIKFSNQPNNSILTEQIRRFSHNCGTGNQGFFSLAYGANLQIDIGNQPLDFSDPNFRIKRYASLFDSEALLTDPIQLLQRIHYRGISCGRFPAKRSLQKLCSSLLKYFELDTSAWLEKNVDFEQLWNRLYSWQQRSLILLLDTMRHLMDAFPNSGQPLGMPGVMVCSAPFRHCTEKYFTNWIKLIDHLFPQLQFIITLPQKYIEEFPKSVFRKHLPIPEPQPSATSKSSKTRIVKPGTILLIQVDGRLPNVALMKLSTYYKSLGYNIELIGKDVLHKSADEVFASCIFFSEASQRHVRKLQNYYGTSLRIGGSGVSLKLRLPKQIEACVPDYSLYPQHQDCAIGFITRGCPYRCAFCVVPNKEGNVRQVSELDNLLDGRKKLILLDDNILAHPKAGNILEQMVKRKIAVNFNQTLDIRLLDNEHISILKRINFCNSRFSRKVIHFSLNGLSGLSKVSNNYARFEFGTRDNVEFICMYGFDTTLREDVERFSFIHSLPGAYVFVQQYQPLINGPAPRSLQFFDDDADALINQLITIEYRQNMKSMEKYYRWISKCYALKFGRLHTNLVNTIFRYNDRDRKGRYIETLAGTKKLPTM